MTTAAVKPDGFQPADSGDELCSEDSGSIGSPGKTLDMWHVIYIYTEGANAQVIQSTIFL